MILSRQKIIRILLLEDNAADAGLIRHALREGGLKHRLEWVDNRAAFIVRLERRPPDLVLSDFALPSFDGYEALELARERWPATPFIFVTGTLGEEVAIETMKKGATDYVLKHRLPRLIPSVQRAMREAGERNERRRAEEMLHQSHEQLRALSVHLQHVREEERTRIAREVHDELGQALTGLKLRLTWLSGRLPGNGSKLQEQTRSMLQHIDETIHAVRRIATELRPGLLDSAGLAAALEWQANKFQKQSGIRCRFISRVRVDVCDPEFNTMFFRIFQETLTNVIRHARATQVDVRLSQEPRHLVLEISDNGRGISDAAIRNTRSLGLLGMRERAALYGGDLEIRGEPAKGTTVRVRVPLRHRRRPNPLHENSHHRRPRRRAPRSAPHPG